MARRIQDPRWVAAAIVFGGVLGALTTLGVPHANVRPLASETAPVRAVEAQRAAPADPAAAMDASAATNCAR